ncbi:MAG TPA: hypothetical protein VEJ86_01655 [Candidatus Binataceae bacterium]|nr:hypothetical protein [Candidatus Binataceae bacterium]
MLKRPDRMALCLAFLVGFGFYELLRFANPGETSLWNRGFGSFVCLLYGLSVVVPVLRMRLQKSRVAGELEIPAR